MVGDETSKVDENINSALRLLLSDLKNHPRISSLTKQVFSINRSKLPREQLTMSNANAKPNAPPEFDDRVESFLQDSRIKKVDKRRSRSSRDMTSVRSTDASKVKGADENKEKREESSQNVRKELDPQ